MPIQHASPPPAAPLPFVRKGATLGPIEQVSATAASPNQARVSEIGQKVMKANPEYGLRPAFVVEPTAKVEVRHTGQQIIVSDGLVNSCETDGQLAAVLCTELAAMVVERQDAKGDIGDERLPPPDVPIGPDGGGFGDQLRKAELNKLGYTRPRATASLPKPNPMEIARRMLVKAGYASPDF